jgi:AcrR family transcriptional regulator
MAVEQGLTNRRRRRGFEFVRKEILTEARALMRAEGVGGLSLGEIARRMEMSTPSLYTYFESKHALYDAVFHEGMQEFRQLVRRVRAEHPDPGDVIHAVMQAYMDFADANPELYALLFERPVPGFVPSAESLSEASLLLEEAGEAFQELLDSGSLVAGLPAAQTRDLFIAVAHGLTALRRANEPNAPPGAGRFAPLVPTAAALLSAAWHMNLPSGDQK